MKRFDNFGEYMFDLLFGPLKKGHRTVNQLFLFFKVIGRQLDDIKKAFFRVRDEANVVSCSTPMLPVHGQDREMKRLEGETPEAYRTRLSMKGLIAEKSGTKQGILYALTALGYDQSHIEPLALQDPERWAEFIIYLKGSKRSGVTNLAVIDAEVRKVKEGSSKPAYGVEAGNVILISSQLKTGFSDYPRCGQLVCGVWPRVTSIGHLFASEVKLQGSASSGDVIFPKVGTFAASKEFYHFGDYTMFAGFTSDLVVESKEALGEKKYLRCSMSARCSSTTHTRGGNS